MARIPTRTMNRPAGVTSAGILTIPQITNLINQLPTGPNTPYPARSLQDIKQLIIHHSAVSSKIQPARLARMHIAQGKPGIVYHLFIADDGAIFQTNALTAVTAHTAGHDEDSLALCFAGNFTRNSPGPAQLQAGSQLLAQLMAMFDLARSNIRGASELSDSQSPGRQWLSGQRWKTRLLRGLPAGSNESSPADQPVQPPEPDPAEDTTAPPEPDSSPNAQLQQLRAQLAKINADHEAAQGEIARLRTENRRLTAELNNARQQPGSSDAQPVSPPPIRDIVDQLTRHAQNRYPTRNLNTIKTIIIHHTAVPGSVSPERIARVHVSQGKAAITYHYLVQENGEVLQTNRLETESQHTAGHDSASIAIAFAGNFTNEVPTPQQLESGAQLVASLQGRFGVARNNIKGASELINTQSPGRQWQSGQGWKQTLFSKLGSTAGNSGPIAPVNDNADLQRQIADLQAKIIELEINLSIAQEASISMNGGMPAMSSGSKPNVRQPIIQDVTDSLPQHLTNRYRTRSTEKISQVIIHHTAVPAVVSAERIARVNIRSNNWPGLGFHYFITADGTIQQTNELTTVTIHAGSHNENSVGVAFAGDFDEMVPTNQQIQAGVRLIAWLVADLNLTISDVHAHKEYAQTSCPGDEWDQNRAWGTTLMDGVQTVLSGAGGFDHQTGGKSLYHYVLFWQTESEWASQDLASATNYLAAFRPSLGFSVDDAIQAAYVTIVGGPLGISAEAEAKIKASGSKVERIAGNSERATKALLDNLARQNKRFLTLEP